MRSLQMPYLRGAFMKTLVGGSWEDIVSRSCKIRTSSRSLHSDLDDALHWCLYESSSGILIGNSCGILKGNSCMMILQGPLQGPSLVSFEILFGVLLWGSGMRHWWLDSPHSRAVTTMFNLICYCSMATVACIWYIDFLPPTLFGASCRCLLGAGYIRLMI